MGSSGPILHCQKTHAVLEQVIGSFSGKHVLDDTRHLCLDN